jgi:argininosuccinate lyase
MSKNKNNKPVWSSRINQKDISAFQKVGSSLNIDKRLFREDISASIVHVEMLEKQKIISLSVKNKIVWGLKRILTDIIKKSLPLMKGMKIFI